MRLAVIADIHGNILALEAVLADIAGLGITEIVNLGDHVSGPLEARKTADLLMERNIQSIQGDQDRRLVELKTAAPSSSKRIDYNQLDGAHFDWMASLPPTIMFLDEIFLCHGSPKSDMTYWLDQIADDGRVVASPIEHIEREAEDIVASLILCAHTHIPRVVRLRDGRIVLNPGSVGLPGYDAKAPVYHKVEVGTPDACYAIVERRSGDWNVTYRYVPYDHRKMSELAKSNGMPVWASALATGWVR
jgi:predicted phosphodiesterase